MKKELFFTLRLLPLLLFCCPAAALPQVPPPVCTGLTTWDGTAWDNGEPDSGKIAVFTGNYTSSGDLETCVVHVTNGAVVVIDNVNATTGHTLTAVNGILVDAGAVLEFRNNAGLLQDEDAVNEGNIKYKRTTPKIVKNDYTYWSSPVAGQVIWDVSPATPADLIYEWNPVINNWVNVPTSTVMEAGKGYIMRGPNTGMWILEPTEYDAYFEGVPHNGDVVVPVVVDASILNLIGNPYPGALNADCFLQDPANADIWGTLYFWAHNIPIDLTGGTQQGFPGSGAYNYNINDYAVYNLLGGVGTGIVNIENNLVSTNRPMGHIAAAQGFFVEGISTGSVVFTNDMRVGSENGNNGQFFRGGTPGDCPVPERHRLWLQITSTDVLSSSPTQFKQTLVGYADGATTSSVLDRDYDAKVFTIDPTVNIYSLAPGSQEKLTI